MPPLPPSSNKDLQRHRIDFKKDDKLTRNDAIRDKHKMRGFSPVLVAKNLTYYTLSPE